MSRSLEALWQCRICGSGDLLATTHRFCPNCSHERDHERSVFPNFAELIAMEAHRFHGRDLVCCGLGWDSSARFCGRCGEPFWVLVVEDGPAEAPTGDEQDERLIHQLLSELHAVIDRAAPREPADRPHPPRSEPVPDWWGEPSDLGLVHHDQAPTWPAIAPLPSDAPEVFVRPPSED